MVCYTCWTEIAGLKRLQKDSNSAPSGLISLLQRRNESTIRYAVGNFKENMIIHYSNSNHSNLILLPYINSKYRAFFQVIEFMESRSPVHNQPVHIINIDIQDNHEEATMGAFLICDLTSMVIIENLS